MYHMVSRDLAGRRIGSRNNKPRLPRLKNIRSKSAVSSFKPGIGYWLEAKGFPPIVHGMFGIAHVKMEMVNGFNLEEIGFLGHGAGFGFRYSRSHSASFSLP